VHFFSFVSVLNDNKNQTTKNGEQTVERHRAHVSVRLALNCLRFYIIQSSVSSLIDNVTTVSLTSLDRSSDNQLNFSTVFDPICVAHMCARMRNLAKILALFRYDEVDNIKPLTERLFKASKAVRAESCTR